MLRFLFRALALLCLACAFAAIVVDGTRSIAADGLVFTTLGQMMKTLTPAALPALEAAAEHIHPWLRDPGLSLLLLAPVWLIFAILGAGLLALTRPRRQTIGFSSR